MEAKALSKLNKSSNALNKSSFNNAVINMNTTLQQTAANSPIYHDDDVSLLEIAQFIIANLLLGKFDFGQLLAPSPSNAPPEVTVINDPDVLLYLDAQEKIHAKMYQLNNEVNALEEKIKNEYGETAVHVHAELYLEPGDADLRDGENELQRNSRIADSIAKILLTSDGSIKPEHADDPLAELLSKRQEMRNLDDDFMYLINKYGKTDLNERLSKEASAELRTDVKRLLGEDSSVTKLGLSKTFDAHSAGVMQIPNSSTIENSRNTMESEVHDNHLDLPLVGR